MKRVLAMLVLMALSACSDGTTDVDLLPGSQAEPTSSTGSVVHEVDWVGYVSDAVDLAQQVYYDPDPVDWNEVRANALMEVEGSPSQQAAHRALSRMLGPTGPLDSHSGFRRPDVSPVFPLEQELPTGASLGPAVGYLKLPGVSTTGEHFLVYAATAHRILNEIAAAARCGWVVDLRDNPGGNMHPMLVAAGPLLGSEEFLGFAKVGGEPTRWYSYQDGQLLLGGEPLVADMNEDTSDRSDELLQAFVLREPFESVPDVPIGVLTSGITASSGELTTIAFKGRPDTRFFGEPTSGYTTGVTSFPLEDGAVMMLPTGVGVDRLGRPYLGSIQPDELILAVPGDNDHAKARATEWILEHAACK